MSELLEKALLSPARLTELARDRESIRGNWCQRIR
jgi:hypothetical protein